MLAFTGFSMSLNTHDVLYIDGELILLEIFHNISVVSREELSQWLPRITSGSTHAIELETVACCHVFDGPGPCPRHIRPVHSPGRLGI